MEVSALWELTYEKVGGVACLTLLALVAAAVPTTRAQNDPFEDPNPNGNYRFLPAAVFAAPNKPPSYSAIGDIGSVDPALPNQEGPKYGWLDVVVASHSSQGNFILVYRNTKDWTPQSDGLTTAEVYDMAFVERNIYGVALADFNADGHLDVAASFQRNLVGDDGPPQVVIMYNDGVGNFTAGVTTIDIPSLYFPSTSQEEIYGIAAYDFSTASSLPDILVAGTFYDDDGCEGFLELVRPAVYQITQVTPGNFQLLDEPYWFEYEDDDPHCVRVAFDVAIAKLRTGGGIPASRRDAVVAIGPPATGTGGENEIPGDDEWVASLLNNGSSFETRTRPGAHSRSIAAGRLRT